MHPIHAFALELSKFWESDPAPFQDLADRLGVSQQRVEDILQGAALPTPVELLLLLTAFRPQITVAEIAVWQTCLMFAAALTAPSSYEGDANTDYLRI
ncbi:helix-turn-helix domain-containing protein, partial [Nonomuraea sp. NPDC001684]